MEVVALFLVGGPAFSGTTLLAHLLNQRDVLCLDEPDFHNPQQSHRGIPFLRKLFPNKSFPERPEKALTFSEAVDLIRECEKVISPCDLGIKTCNRIFIEYAKIYKSLKYPVIAIVRDIRDSLVGSLPEWVTEQSLNRSHRLVWENLKMYDLWLRYEDLVMDPHQAVADISRVLSRDLEVRTNWDVESVHRPMFKSDRHELLRAGTISRARVGIWRDSGKAFSDETHKTAKMMGYA